jgi:hypothetical protein
MDNDETLKIKQWHRKIKLMWFVILAGMLILTFIILLLQQLEVLKEPLTENPVEINKIMLLVVFILAALIIVLKRTFFVKNKLILSACRKLNINLDEADEEQKENILDLVFSRIQIYQYVVWLMADAIVIIGFVNYIFILSIQASMMYCVVGIYSMLISYPRLSLLEGCYYHIKE